MINVYNRRKNKQYSFDQDAAYWFADLLEPFQRPCVLCAPTVGIELEDRGVQVTTLDMDERFASLRSFKKWDVLRPTLLGEEFDIIFCDPPLSVSLSQLFNAIRLLARFDFAHPVMITYLTRRSDALLSTFAPFKLLETAFRPNYRSMGNRDPTKSQYLQTLKSARRMIKHGNLCGKRCSDCSYLW